MTGGIEEVLENLYQRYGYDFTGYAPDSIERRVNFFMDFNKIASFKDLNSMLLKDEKTAEDFIRNMSVTFTEIFRDPDFYSSIRANVIPSLNTYPLLKIWVAGCATGEEAYSIAILLKEEGLLDRSIIYATDINQSSLDIARQGIYPINNMQKYTTNYISAGGKASLSDYYTAKYDFVLFDKEIRDKIVFSPHNLVTDHSFNEFHLIMCRNVLIYFKNGLQDKTIALFNKSLCNLGYLCLGKGESLQFNNQRRFFNDVDRREKIFIKSTVK